MADDNNFMGINTPQLEETTYVPKAKNPANSLDDIAVPVLEETTYVPKNKTAGLDGISAPNLSDTYSAPGTVQSNNAPQYQQYGSAQSQSQSAPQYQQYGSGSAAAMDYNPTAKNPNHNLDDIQKPVLEDEPPAQERYVPKYQDPDLEAAKKQSVDRAIKSSLASKPASFDEEKSREAYREFMRERDSEMAQKGAFQVTILAIIGILSGIFAIIFSFMPLKENTPGFLDLCNMLYIALGAAIAGGSIAMFVRSTTTQKAASSIFIITTILHVVPGAFVLFTKVKGAFPTSLYVLVLILNIIVSFIFGSNENIKKHYNGH